MVLKLSKKVHFLQFCVADSKKAKSVKVIYIYQGIIQTKMEVGIRFWAPNLGLTPKYD